MPITFSRMGCTASKEYNILIVGLDNVGKSTLVQRLQKGEGELLPTVPTIGSQTQSVNFNGKHLILWDVGGQTDQRNIWKHYYVGTHGLVFVVDAADESRFEESYKEFVNVIEAQYLNGIPCLLLGNKSDIEGAADEEKLKTTFHIEQYEKENGIAFKVENCSALTGAGITEGFSWLLEMMEQ